MRIRFSKKSMLALAALSGAAAALADGPVVRDQSDLATDNSFNMSEFVVANDFVIAGPTRLMSVEVFLADNVANDNGVLDSFGSGITWQIRGDSSGEPGGLVVAGRSLPVVQRDTGIQDDFGDDIVSVRFDFNRPISVQAGTFWLLLHEGDFGTYDGSRIWWAIASNSVGADQHTATSPAGPWSSSGADSAFVLFGTRPAWDQSFLAGAAGEGTLIGSYVTANDVVLAASASFSSLEAWLVDGSAVANGDLDTFSGALSWAVYANGAGKPATEIAHGNGQHIRVVDAELASSGGKDIGRVQIGLGRSVALAAGTYWLALHEGAWGSAYDGSDILWADSSSSLGSGQWVDSNEVAPGAFPSSLAFNSAFVLFDDVLFASGFEAGVTCSWSNGATTACP